MNFEYTMNSDEFHCRIKIKTNLLTNEEIFVVENWLMTDIIDPENTIKYFSSALNKGDDYVKNWIGGNEFWWKIEKGYTLFEYQTEERFEEGKCPFKPCKISTKLLCEILEVWAVEYKKWVEEREEFVKKNPNYRPKVLGSFKDLFPWKK